VLQIFLSPMSRNPNIRNVQRYIVDVIPDKERIIPEPLRYRYFLFF
jgi:hypothetical protein